MERVLDPADVVIADDSGAVALAGVMGGLTTEIDDASTSVVLETAHFQPALVAATSRRHKLSSEASRRFERGIDSDVALAASNRAAQLFADLAGAAIGGLVDVDRREPVAVVEMSMDMPSRIVGVDVPEGTVRSILERIGCTLDGDSVTPPVWRPDLTAAIDLVEEVARVVGYETIPSRGPAMGTGVGLSQRDTMIRQLRRRPAELGLVEVLSSRSWASRHLDALGLPADDPRRTSVRLANPLSDEQPLMRHHGSPGPAQHRPSERGPGRRLLAPLRVRSGLPRRRRDQRSGREAGSRPSDEQIEAMLSALPRQPEHLGLVLCGDWSLAGWWGAARPVDSSDAVRLSRAVADAVGATVDVEPDPPAPWHPGRCARLTCGGRLIGHAGELHPDVVAAYGCHRAVVPPRST